MDGESAGNGECLAPLIILRSFLRYDYVLTRKLTRALLYKDDQECEIGYPAHGAEIPNLHAKIESELVQKERREKQILSKLNQIKRQEQANGGTGRRLGSVTVEELVLQMHGKQVDSEVRKMALEPFVDEVLRKMLKDGKVAFERRKGAERRWFAVRTP